ncbi:MAG: ABC transporter permease subunit [Verrucomicrobiota bacterium]|jgi:hypothetical protein
MNPGPPSPPSPPPPPPLPGFFAVLRGVWLLTWKAQWNWRRLAGLAGAMLVLPALVLLTTASPTSWARRQLAFGDAGAQVTSFGRRLARKGFPLSPQQRAQLKVILAEEYARAGNSFQEQPGESAESRTQRLKDQIDACGERMVTRAQLMLNAKQLAEFQDFEKKNRPAIVARLNEPAPSWGRTAPFYHWLVDFYFFIILPLTCVRGSGALIRDELQADTLGFLITRPVSRARLLLAKYLAQTAWLEILLLLETLLLFAVGEARQIPALGALLPLLLAVQFLAIPAWSALGVLFGQVTSRFMAAALVYGAIVEMGIGRIPTNINTLSLMRHIKTLLSHNAALQGTYDWQPGGVATAIAALVIAPLLFFGVAALLFSLIEYHHATEMQK